MQTRDFNNQQKSNISRLEPWRFLLPGIAVFCLFFVASCNLITNKFIGRDAPPPDNINANSNPVIKSPPPSDDGKYQALLDQGKGIETEIYPVKITPAATIKGKVFVVENVEAGNHEYDQYIADNRKAHSLEELQTIVRIICSKGKFLNNYSDPTPYGSKDIIRAYGINCQVSVIDYLSKVITAQKNISNNEKSELISQRKVSAGEFINEPPQGEIKKYLNNLVVDKPLPNMTKLEAKELVRFPVTISLKPDAAINGQIFIAQKYEKGDQSTNLISEIYDYDKYGFAYEKFTDKPAELGTLIRIICTPGSPIGKVEKTVEISNKCEVSLIDYKTLTVFAQKIIENKNLANSGAITKYNGEKWIVDLPKQEIENYLKSFPNSK